MPNDAFDIYQGPTGPTAVTNEVQRAILAALMEGEKQLPELVQITGRSKPTLSGSHMKELLNRELIVERTHPEDNRRKIYRLNAKPLGSSDVPVDELRNAVKAYAQTAIQGGIALEAVFLTLAAAGNAKSALQAQARHLGSLLASRIGGDDARSFAVALSRFVEQERLVHHLQLDFEALTFRCRPGQALRDVDVGTMGLLLAAFAEGAGKAKGLDVAFASAPDGDAFRLTPN